MLIQALCEYYDELEKDGKVVPAGYSWQGVHYLICLNPDGTLGDIIDYQLKEETVSKNGKVKEKFIPRNILLPLRTEKPGINANIIEHRSLYIFGLNLEGDTFTCEDKTNKAKKSHAAFREKNLAFIEGLDSPVINAFRNFLLCWQPEREMQNPLLVQLGKAYKGAYFAFCLNGFTNILLHEDAQMKEKWQAYSAENISEGEVYAQCAVTGKTQPIARIHNKIKGVSGGQPSGTVLVGYKTTAGCSYGNEQSYNSNISAAVMQKYTYALNHLLGNSAHKNLMDDITVIFWATGGDKNQHCTDYLSAFLFGDSEKMDAEHTDGMLRAMFSRAREGQIAIDNLSAVDDIDENVGFYIVGIKPNASRLSLKFLYRRKFGEILSCIAKHQYDMQIGEEIKTIPLWKLKNELKSPHGSNEKVDASLMAEIFKAIIYGKPYPDYLLSTLLMRIKTDRNINRVRAGAVKACINRKTKFAGKKEDLELALDKNNVNQAYLCGRLFAVLEKIQQSASPSKLNRTIKDAYFSSAASKPALIFPKLLTLSQNHIKKLSEGTAIFYNKLGEEIIGKLNGAFPEILSLTEQGKFMIGYYQQNEVFYKKNDDNKKEDK